MDLQSHEEKSFLILDLINLVGVYVCCAWKKEKHYCYCINSLKYSKINITYYLLTYVFNYEIIWNPADNKIFTFFLHFSCLGPSRLYRWCDRNYKNRTMWRSADRLPKRQIPIFLSSCTGSQFRLCHFCRRFCQTQWGKLFDEVNSFQPALSQYSLSTASWLK